MPASIWPLNSRKVWHHVSPFYLDARIHKALERILPDVLDALDPRWQDFAESGKDDFGAFLEPHQEEVSDEIMNIADKHVEKVNSAALRKPYNSLRGKATKILSPEVPAFGRVVQKHM